MQAIKPGLWEWQAPHPDWSPEEPWPRLVSSHAIDDGTHLVLVDPLDVPDEVLHLASSREPIIVLTAPWHERDTMILVDRLRAPVWTPRPDAADDLVRKYGITLEQADGGSPDLAWLFERRSDVARPYGAGDQLPFGIEASMGREENDLVLWFEGSGAVISGDTLVDFGDGFGINRWLRGGVTRHDVADRLRPLLDRPIEVVLTAHGAPTDRSGLDRALDGAHGDDADISEPKGHD